MYDSKITAKAFLETIKSETDISLQIPDASWIRWINTVEQFLYTEILREYAKKEMQYQDATISLSEIGENVTYDDIVRIYGDDVELDRAGVISGSIFPDKPMYWTDYVGNVVLNTPDKPATVSFVYVLRPAIKVTGEETIALPVEWLDMLAARLRAEAYKICNTDEQAGKWMQDYNTQLESFKVWAMKRNERYGE